MNRVPVCVSPNYIKVTNLSCGNCPVLGYFGTWVYDPLLPWGTTGGCNIPLCGPNLVCNGCFDLGNLNNASNALCFTSGLNQYLSGNWAVGDYVITTNIGALCSQFIGVPYPPCNYFMALDGIGGQTVPYNLWEQTDPVCPQTIYIFSAWFLDIDKYDNIIPQPFIELCVDNDHNVVPFQIVDRNNIAGDNWIQFCGSWFSGTNNMADLQINMFASDDDGYDVGICDIEFHQASLSVAITNVINVLSDCNSLGSATANSCGATSYLWSNGQSTQTATGLQVGTYTVTATLGGCTATASVTIIQTATFTVPYTVQNTCNGGCNGYIIFYPTGNPPYNYYWNVNQSSQLIGSHINSNSFFWNHNTGLCAGTYQILIIDANGCQVTLNITITNDPPIQLNISDADELCFGQSIGEITLWVNGGTSPYTYTWNPSVSSFNSAHFLPVGNYSVTVTDAYNCTATATDIITQPPLLIAEVSARPDVICTEGTTDIYGQVYGGTPVYHYLWSNGATTLNIFNVPAGTYTLIVTDENGCTATASITISTDPPMTLSMGMQQPCPNHFLDGAAWVLVSGGTGPFTYTWTATNPNLPNTTVVTSIINTSTITGFYAAFPITIIVTDANGCTATASIDVYKYPTPDIIITHSPCGVVNGSGFITATASGGVGPLFTFEWSNSTTDANVTTSTISNLAWGTYYLTVIDQGSLCTFFYPIIIDPPINLSITPLTNVLCNNGPGALTFGDPTAQLNPTGGTSPYYYTWSPSSTDISVNGNNVSDNFTSTSSSSYSYSYTFTVTDAAGCSATATWVINVPSVLVLSSTFPGPCTFGNSISVSASGGTQPYQFLWSNNATTSTISNLAVGSYTVTLTDADGCSLTETFNIDSPMSLSLSTGDPVLCNNGFGALTTGQPYACVHITGGATPYTYSWTPTTYLTTSTSACTTASIINSNPNPNAYTVTYIVTVTDADGCTASATWTIPVPPVLVVQSNYTTPCNFVGTTINMFVSGGTPIYTYLWSGGSSPTSATNTFLVNGWYTVTVSDANGCSNTATFLIDPPINLSLSGSTDDLCNWGIGINLFGDASTNVTVNGGTPLYTYAWTPSFLGNGPSVTWTFPSTTTNAYTEYCTVTVTDNYGCTAIEDWDFYVPSPLWSTGSILSQPCPNPSGGSITVQGMGGTQFSNSPYYDYLWSNSATTPTISNLTAGTYNCTITDANGCTTFASYTIGNQTCSPPTGWNILFAAHWSGNTYTVVGNEVWSNTFPLSTNEIYIPGNIVVSPGCSLEISAGMLLYFNAGCEIIVQNGATLWLSGCTLNSACETMWGGIEVWGIPYDGQDATQGQIIMDLSVIENAYHAVYLGEIGAAPGFSEGGIITANSGIANQIVDCQTGITFPNWYYTPSKSIINNVVFSSDRDLYNPCDVNYTSRPYYFISISGENNISIGSNSYTVSPAGTPNNTYGIISTANGGVGASWNTPIGPFPLPQLNIPMGSTFNGVRHGIDIKGTNMNNNPHWIYHNHFENCEIAINIYGNNQLATSAPQTGISNDFFGYNVITNGYYYGPGLFTTNNVYYYYTSITNPTFGIYTDFTDNLLVDNNEINGVDFGIVINRSSGGINNPNNPTHVFRNTFFLMPYELNTGGQNNQIDIRCNFFYTYSKVGWNIYDCLPGDCNVPMQGDFLNHTYMPGNYFFHAIGAFDVANNSFSPVKNYTGWYLLDAFTNSMGCTLTNYYNPCYTTGGPFTTIYQPNQPIIPSPPCDDAVFYQYRTINNINDSPNIIMTEAWLGNNRPNPFNEMTEIPYFVPSSSTASMIIYDVLGQKIGNYQLQSGSNQIFTFDCTSCGYGVYIYCLEVDGRIIDRKRMVIMK